MGKQKKRLATDPDVNTAGISPIDMNSTSDTRARRLRGKVAPQTGSPIVKGAGASGSAAMGIGGGRMPGRVQAAGGAVLKPANRRGSAQKPKGAKVVEKAIDPNDSTLRPHDPYDRRHLSKQAAERDALKERKDQEKARATADRAAKGLPAPRPETEDAEALAEGIPSYDPDADRMAPPETAPWEPPAKQSGSLMKPTRKPQGKPYVPSKKASKAHIPGTKVSTEEADEDPEEGDPTAAEVGVQQEGETTGSPLDDDVMGEEDAGEPEPEPEPQGKPSQGKKTAREKAQKRQQGKKKKKAKRK